MRRAEGIHQPIEGDAVIITNELTPQELLEHHRATGEPLDEDEVASLIEAGLTTMSEWDDRGGGLYWHATTFPEPEG